jgi:hypothetical protein
MIVSLYAAILAGLFVFLSAHVIRGRWQYKITMTDGGNEDMKRRIRAQGNFAEYAPLFILLLGFAEYNGLPIYVIHIFGIVFIIARLSHAYGILKSEVHDENKMKVLRFRIRGVIFTLASITILSAILLVQYILRVL